MQTCNLKYDSLAKSVSAALFEQQGLELLFLVSHIFLLEKLFGTRVGGF